MLNLFRLRMQLLALSCCQVACSLPACAQEVQYRGGRITNGSVEQRGWEAGMVKGCPNLSHFHWSPMTTMIQAPVAIPVGTTTIKRDPQNPMLDANNRPALTTGYGDSKPVTPNVTYQRTPYVRPDRVAPGATNGLNGSLLPRHYVKPEHVPTMALPPGGDGDIHGSLNNRNLNGQLLPRRYVKPIHAPMPMKLPTPDGSGDVHGSLVNNHINGQLLNRHGADQAVAGRMVPQVASYGGSPYNPGYAGGDTGGRGARAEVSATLASPHRGSMLLRR